MERGVYAKGTEAEIMKMLRFEVPKCQETWETEKRFPLHEWLGHLGKHCDLPIRFWDRVPAKNGFQSFPSVKD